MIGHKKPLYREIASLVDARRRCIATNNGEWKDRHGDTLRLLCKEFMPRGSGIDGGTLLDLDASTGDRLVFETSYHHMNDVGMHDGWTDHKVIVKPSLALRFDIRITGRDRNQIKDYLHEVFSGDLKQEIWWTRNEETDTVAWHTDRYGAPVEQYANGGGI